MLGQDLRGIRVDEEETLLGSGRSKRALSDVPVAEAAQYFGAWIELLEPVSEELEQQLEGMKARPMLDDLEMPLVPVLAAMERRGVAVDCDLLQEISAEMYTRITTLEQEMHELAGYTFNPGSTQKLARLLYDDLGLRQAVASKQAAAPTPTRWKRCGPSTRWSAWSWNGAN